MSIPFFKILIIFQNLLWNISTIYIYVDTGKILRLADIYLELFFQHFFGVNAHTVFYYFKMQMRTVTDFIFCSVAHNAYNIAAFNVSALFYLVERGKI